MTRWVGRTATEIAAAVRAGEATAGEIVREHLDRIARLNGELGAFVRVRAAEAVDEAAAVDIRADRADLPLAGVPVAVKDNVPVAGEPMRVGSAATPETPQDTDHPVVARLRAAGAVVVGLTNLPELGIYPFTDSVYGVARNPWDRRRTPGGSSGGSAAAVASGMVPVAHGNDGAGSIRIPAAACGLFGIKPGPGIVPAELGATNWYGMSENGPLTTDVADAALLLSVMAADASLASPSTPDALRVAVSGRSPGPGVPVHREWVAAAREAGTLIGGLGHTVVHDDPGYPLWSAQVTIARWFAATVPEAQPLAGGLLERRTRRHVAAGRLMMRLRPPRDTDRERLRTALGPFFERHDVLVMPTLARSAPPARRWGERSWLRSVATSLRFAPMAGIWNLAGYPAAAVPVGSASVQLVAAPGNEALLLGLAEQLEELHPWTRHARAYTPS